MQRVTGLRTGWLLSAAAMLIGGWSMPAAAADLGGDCCADLEERIAELEATTARKGNRKVSLTVSGWVNEAVFFWDDGNERNVYVGTNFIEQSRFRFLGEAKINADWSAGYILEIGVAGYPSNQWNQAGPGSASANPSARITRPAFAKVPGISRASDWARSPSVRTEPLRIISSTMPTQR